MEVTTEDWEAWHKTGIKDGAELGNNRFDPNIALLERAVIKSSVGKCYDATALAVMAHPTDFIETSVVCGPYPLPATQLARLLLPLDCNEQRFLVTLRAFVTTELQQWPAHLAHNQYSAAHSRAALRVNINGLKFALKAKYTQVALNLCTFMSYFSF